MSVYTSQTEADAEVIRNLMREIRRLTPMPLLQLADGRVVRVEHFEVVSQDELQSEVAELNDKLTHLQSLLTPAAAAAPDDGVAAPAAPAPEDVPAPQPTAPEEPVTVPAPTVDSTPPEADPVTDAPVEQPPLQ